MNLVVGIALAVALFLICREAIKHFPKKKEKGDNKEVAVLELVGKLKDLTIGDVCDRLTSIHEAAGIVRAGSEAVTKELQATYEKVIASKLTNDVGRALISAKLATAEKAIAEVAKVTLATAILMPK
jgi:hypothetical protein